MKKQTWAEDQKLKINLEWPYHWDFITQALSVPLWQPTYLQSAVT